MPPGDLAKLTVTQLKALCKEKGLVGYSKLTKGALVEKLLAHEDAKDAHVGDKSTVATTSIARSSSKTKKKNKTKSNGNESPVDTNLVATTSAPANQKDASINRVEQVTENRAHICGQNDSDDNAEQDILEQNPPSSHFPENEPPRKKQKLENSKTKENQEQGHNTTVSIPAGRGNIARADTRAQSVSVTRANAKEGINNLDASSTVAAQVKTLAVSLGQPKVKNSTSGGKLGSSKKYIPLVVKQLVHNPQSTSTSIPNVEERCRASPSLTPSKRWFPNNIEVNYYLDFPLLPETSPEFLPNHCHPILLPPSLHQRPLLCSLTIVLRDITLEDLHNISLTTKVWRYAAHMSAEVYLRRWFPGKRLEDVIEKVRGLERDKGKGQGRMGLWKYRVAREREYEERKRRFEGLFLGRILDGGRAIADRVWRSGESGKEAVVAVRSANTILTSQGIDNANRFLLTRYWFCVSLGLDIGEMVKWGVIDVREVARGEVWCITTAKRDAGSQKVQYYVLEATCEIVGTPLATEQTRLPTNHDGGLPIRSDWSAYIQKRATEGEETGASILESVRWTNHEEYERGISRLWLRKIKGEGGAGEAKKVVSERYVMACAMGNSLSGRYMNAREMEQELNGLPTRMELGKLGCQRSARVNLFLHAHHHVESVHFTTATGKRLHPALAVVQTPGREYYVLKDNGMMVGCEEEGVSEVWMEIIGCSGNGEPEVVTSGADQK